MNNNSEELLEHQFVMSMINNALLLKIIQSIGIEKEEIDKLIKIGTTSAIEALNEFNKKRGE